MPRPLSEKLWLASSLLLGALVASVGAAEPAASYPDDLAALAKLQGVEIVFDRLEFPVKSSYGETTGEGASEEELQAYAALFVQEFSLYPAELLRQAKLKRVVLCRELAFAGQRRNAVPDFEHDTLYLDVARGAYSPLYMRSVIHHEFFHIIDIHDDGELYRDGDWAALNPREFRYGSGGQNAQDNSSTSLLTDKTAGFLTHYSTTGVEEDKAELFAHLIVSAKHVQERAAKEPVLRAKVERMKELLAEFCPQMDGDFWEQVERAKRPRARDRVQGNRVQGNRVQD